MRDNHKGDPGITGSVGGDVVCAGGKLQIPTLPPSLDLFQNQNSFLGFRSHDSVPTHQSGSDKISGRSHNA